MAKSHGKPDLTLEEPREALCREFDFIEEMSTNNQFFGRLLTVMWWAEFLCVTASRAIFVRLVGISVTKSARNGVARDLRRKCLVAKLQFS
jgi:hypothetical protein